MSCTQEVIEELVWDFNYNALDKWQVHQATQDQCRSEESSLSLDEAQTMLRLREGTMERFVQSLVPSFPDGSISTTSTIFCMYEMFTSATQVLGQQFNR
ncbi:ral guanine nucleotide dissociation stimulator-like [Ursus arctos]|uniref:ral guanine nucleotide dissociation stimulator-like n=1 Tax=Ursus arctos TaxID=9644 RepID=UPI0025482FA6|nr:ral guanine nucleotide dissociation stimulator-like [Ursus arctos]